MKLHLRYLLSIISLSIILSCNNDDNGNASIGAPDENALVIKKVTQTTYYDQVNYDTSESNFYYDSTQQLISIATVSGISTYTSTFNYNGNFITSVDYLENGNPDGVTTLYYDGDLLMSTLSGINQDERADYTYESGNVKSLKYYYPAGPDEQLFQAQFYTYANGNVIEKRKNDYFFGTSQSLTKYTYDGKNNPLKSMNKYLKLILANEGFNGLSLSNPVSHRSFNPIDELIPEEYYYVMVYNSENYPTSIKRFSSETDTLISDTVIEYQ